MFSKNLAISLAVILFLTLGALAGYLLGKGNSSGSAPVVAGNSAGDNPAVAIKPAKTDMTAKEASAIALAEARSWSADAYLAEMNLASKKISGGGEATGWKIIFYSKSKNMLYDVLIKDGESRGGEERALPDKKSPQTLKGEMIDSPALAKSFFASYPANTEIINLKMYYDAGAKKFIWTIFFPKGSHTIDGEI